MTVFFRVLSDLITVFQITDTNILPIVEVTDVIEISDIVDPYTGLIPVLVQSDIELDQIIESSIHPETSHHTILLDHRVSVIRTLATRSIIHNLSIGHFGVRNRVEVVSQAVSLSQSVSVESVVPSIEFVDALVLDHDLSFTKDKHLVITQHISLSNHVRDFLFDVHFIQSVVTPALANEKIILTYNGLVLQLRDPEFGDINKYEQSRILRRNRGNELNIFRDQALPWPDTQVISYSFKHLKQVDVSNLLNFMQVSIGKEIQLQDHESYNWTGVIITPEKEMIEEDRTGFSASFDFQGVRT